VIRLSSAVLLLCAVTSACKRGSKSEAKAEAGPRRLVVLHTNDLHDHLAGNGTVGGFARLATAIGERRKAAGTTPVLLVDAGDFSMGTPFTLLNPSAAPQLVLMHHLGYDAIAIGNHDLDWGPDGLATMLDRARASGFDVPLLSANATFDADDPGDDALAALRSAGLLRDKLVETLPGGLRVGLFGLLGPDAYDVSPDAKPLAFDSTMEAHAASAQRVVDDLRRNDGVDLVIAVAHEGCAPDGTGEACDLGRAVDGIDLIVGGHTHGALEKPVTAGRTAVVQTSSAGEFLGEVVLEVAGDGAVSVVGNSLVRMDERVREDSAVAQRVAAYIELLDKKLGAYALGAGAKARRITYDQTIAESDFAVGHEAFREDPIGDLVTDAYLRVAGDLAPAARPVIAIEATGLIRDGLQPRPDGSLRFADLYRVLPLGRGPDGEVGYPLVTYHLSAVDLRAGLEIAALAANMKMAKLVKYFLQTSGLRARYRTGAPMFQSVESIALASGEKLDLKNDTRCVRVVSSLRVGELLTTVDKLSRGMLRMVPREADCKTPVTDWQAHLVDADAEAEGIQELKSWHALLRYTAGLPDLDDDGIPDLPPVYRRAQDRFAAVE